MIKINKLQCITFVIEGL